MRTCWAGVAELNFSHGVITTVLIGLLAGTVSSSCAELVTPTSGVVVVCLPAPIGGTGLPGVRTNADEGRLLVSADAPRPPVQAGTSTTRSPWPLGSSMLVAPVVSSTAVAFCESTFDPVPH